jgi:hypothetical protein
MAHVPLSLRRQFIANAAASQSNRDKPSGGAAAAITVSKR